MEELENNGYFIATIDGNECRNLELFPEKIGEAFHFPGYYGRNLNAAPELFFVEMFQLLIY
jgi:RNAse (barnase) inhibitor barstar